MAASSGLRDLSGYFVYILLVSTIGPLLFGYHLAELNAPQDVISCSKDAIRTTGSKRTTLLRELPHLHTNDLALPQCIHMDHPQFALVSSFFTLGGLLGALASGPLSAKSGRLRVMLVTSLFFIVGSLLEAVAMNIAMLIIGRFLSGIGAGAAIVVVPIYISETAPPKQKGLFGAFTQIMVNVGILIAQLLGYFLSRGQLWRIILGVGGAIALAQTVGLLLAGQESPKWMADNGKPARAKKALRNLRGHKVDIEEEVAGWGAESERDMEDEEETLLAGEDRMHHHPSDPDDDDGRSRGHDGTEDVASLAHAAKKATKRETLGVLAVLRHPESRPAIFAVVMVMLAQQLCGINSIVMYGVSLLADLLESNSALLNILVAALNVVVTTAAAPLVDKLGRKTCLLMSIAGMGTNSILLAVGIMRHIPVLSAVAALLFVASFGLGLGPVPFILSSELVGAEAVGATQSWALAASWIATFAVAQFFPILNDIMGKGQVYFIFAAFALFFGIITVFFVPETKGKKSPDEVWGRGKATERVD